MTERTWHIPEERDKQQHSMAEHWLDWKKFDGERMKTNSKFVLVLMPKNGPSGRIQGCQIKDGRPFVIGGIFAWDYGKDKPTHWAEYPDLPSGAT